MIGILEVNHPENFSEKMHKKYQHQKTDRPIKHHMYSKIINKCKYQMAHKPSKQKPSCTKKCFSRDTIPPYFKTIHTIPRKNTKTVVCTWQQN